MTNPVSEQILNFLGEIVAYGGSSAAIAYLLFQFLGKNWIESKFAQQLEQLKHQFAQQLEQSKHQQSLELQRLRVEIDSLLNGVLKLQEREFEVLPEAWQKLNDAYELISWIVSPFQELPDLDSMSEQQREEFLSQIKLTETQKQEIRTSTNKVKCFHNNIFWYHLDNVRIALLELQKFVARNGIFFPIELKEKFARITELLRSSLLSKQFGHRDHDNKMQREAWEKINDEIKPLYEAIESDINIRLRSHGRRS